MCIKRKFAIKKKCKFICDASKFSPLPQSIYIYIYMDFYGHWPHSDIKIKKSFETFYMHFESLWGRDVRFGPKVVRLASKWNKYGNFSDQISVHLGSSSQNVLKSDIKEVPDFFHLVPNSTTLDQNLTSLVMWKDIMMMMWCSDT